MATVAAVALLRLLLMEKRRGIESTSVRERKRERERERERERKNSRKKKKESARRGENCKENERGRGKK